MRRTAAISTPDDTHTNGTSPDPFGPSLAYVAGSLLDTGVQPDRLVPTHCCFCGQQCGMYLKVKDERVVGVEPRTDFPFNQGKLCPKGISRYLQNHHPDRLLRAYCRDGDAPGGFRAIGYDEASRASPARSSASSGPTAPTRWPCSAVRASPPRRPTSWGSSLASA